MKMNYGIRMLPIRAQATAAGLVQLCAELHSSGMLSDAAMTRIKEAIADELAEHAPRSVKKHAFRCEIHQRLDKVFDVSEPIAASAVSFDRASLRTI